MIRINYITNLDVNEFSGGWSGMNHNVYGQLKKRFEVHTVQKVNPPYSPRVVYASKAAKVLGLKRTFPAFTARRLKQIADEVSSKRDDKAALNFYHGATPWLLTGNNVPYAMYLDCCFATYIRVYHDQSKFSARQLKYIFDKERDFLNNALCVFFSSKWAMDEAANSYNLQARNFYVAGLGGGLTTETVQYSNEKYFLFAGLDFFGKGGDLLVKAFAEVQKLHPGFKLKIVGEKPPPDFLSIPNVEYAGRFNKSNHDEAKQLLDLFKNAYCFVLPTSKDMTPLVLVEAASLGCPVIAMNNFGIPDIVKHNETGLLVDPVKPIHEQLVAAMNEVIVNTATHRKFSENAKVHINDNFSWSRTGTIICDQILESLS
ncbi:MAG: glycosyltransferase family 4 protein [Chitinophagaceae bacterium]|nr:glycosyltransferase family 4 protein [Chitinophagaceae bacterium]